MAYCLTKPLAKKFLDKIKDGTINPIKLAAMTSEQRRAFFAKIIGEDNARKVNALFEAKLLLKNQQKGMITWVKTVGNLKPDVKRDLISRIMKMDEILQPKEVDAFLEDLASHKLGTAITIKEAEEITEFTKDIEEKKKGDMSVNNDRIEYGRSLMALDDYLNKLNPQKANLMVNFLNLPRTLMSTLDFSAPLRQGWGMVSRKQFYPAFAKMFNYAFSEEAYQNLIADITTRETYPLMKAGRLRITRLTDKLSQREEIFMSSLLDKFPGVRQSERAYIGFLNKIRADVFDDLVRQAELTGEDVTKNSKVIRDIASVVNDFSGSGHLGNADKYSNVVPVLNGLLFSPRKLSATVNMFNPKRYITASPTARKAALRQLIGSMSFTFGVLSLAALFGADIEKDPRSSDFGKLKIGNTRIDVSGGNANYLVLMARLVTNKTKSTTTKLMKELGEGYGARTKGDTIMSFVRNKFSPNASFVADWLYGENAIGEPFKVTESLRKRAIPLIIQDIIEVAKEDPSMVFYSAMANLFGAGSQSYDMAVDWSIKPGKELQQFLDKVGDDEFKEANHEYNIELQKQFKTLGNSEEYQALSDNEKQKEITRLRNKIKQQILRDHNFKYQR
jgi:hypothetical protein